MTEMGSDVDVERRGSDGSKAKRGSKSVMFDLRRNDLNPRHSPNISPRTSPDEAEDSRSGDGMTDEQHDMTASTDEAQAPSNNQIDGDDDRDCRRHAHKRWVSDHISGGVETGAGGRMSNSHGRQRNGHGGESDNGLLHRNGHSVPGAAATHPRRGRSDNESDDSSETISLPDRFDAQGRRIPEAGGEEHVERFDDDEHGWKGPDTKFRGFSRSFMGTWSARQ